MNLTAQKLSGCTWGKKKLAAQKDERPRGPSILGTVGSTGQPTVQREARCRERASGTLQNPGQGTSPSELQFPICEMRELASEIPAGPTLF